MEVIIVSTSLIRLLWKLNKIKMYKARKKVFAISNTIHFFQQMFIQQIHSKMFII